MWSQLGVLEFVSDGLGLGDRWVQAAHLGPQGLNVLRLDVLDQALLRVIGDLDLVRWRRGQRARGGDRGVDSHGGDDLGNIAGGTLTGCLMR